MSILDSNNDGHIDMTEFLVAVRVSKNFILASTSPKFKLSGKIDSCIIGYKNLSAIFGRNRA